MAITAGAEYRLTRHRDTLNIVGNFYNCMTAAMIDGRVTPRGQLKLADAYNLKLGVRIETKARNSNNSFGIKISQKIGYDDEPPFPITDSLYCLVSYCQKGSEDQDGRRPNLLRQSRTRKAKYALLARRVRTSYLLDLPLVTALQKRLGTRQGLFIGTETVLEVARRKHLWPLQGATCAESLRELGLRPRDWIQTKNRLSFEVTLFDEEVEQTFVNMVELALVTVLRRSTHARIMPTILAKALTLV